MVFSNVLTNGVPKVTEALRVPFWHFWHPLTLGISRVELPNRGAERGAIQRKRDPGWKPSRAYSLPTKRGCGQDHPKGRFCNASEILHVKDIGPEPASASARF